MIYILYIFYFFSFRTSHLGIFLVGYWMFLTVNSFCYFEIYSSSLSEKNLNVLTQKIKLGKALEVRRMFWQYDIYFIYILFLFIQNLSFRYLFSRLLNVFNSSSLSEKNLNVLTQKIKLGKALEVRRMF